MNTIDEPILEKFDEPIDNITILKQGYAIAIEPMLNLGCDEVVVAEDDWTVITADKKYSHGGSVMTLNGWVEDEGLQRFSLEKLVDERTSPAFLWHTAEDKCVPVMNSLLYATALMENNIPFELHVFPKGCHGLSLCNKETSVGNPGLDMPYNAVWLEMAIRFVNECPFEK